jgi:hypothetical protein
MVEWLAQPVTVPLWGFLIALILPVAYFSKLAKERVGAYLNGPDG